jgi:lipoprotein-anchoring transpeptidase ErfK/SrfK
VAEEAPRGKHTRTKGRRRRPSPVNRATKVMTAGFLVAVVGGSVAYGAVATVGHRSDSITVASATDGVVPDRTLDQRSSRSIGTCGRTGPGQARVEKYLQTQTARFGKVTVDATQDASDCSAIKAFQTWLQLPASSVTGFADEQTAEIADRLANSKPASCQASASATTVCVDLTDQTLWVMRGGSIVFQPTVIRSGAKSEATPAGSFQITEKKQVTISTEYGTPLPYWERFYADFGIHATDTSLYAATAPGSHGCVNLLKRDAQQLYAVTRVGSSVHVFGHKANT